MVPFKHYEQLSELVKMYPCSYNKQEKDFKKEEVKQRALEEIAKEVDLENGKVVEQLWNKSVFFTFCFLVEALYIDVEPKLMMPEAVNDVCIPSLCFHEIIFSSKFVDNISLVGMCWRQKFIGQYKNTPLKMSLSPGNKSGNRFNFYLENSVTLWKPSLREIMALLKV